MSNKRWIADDVGELGGGADGVPIKREGIAFDDIAIGLEWEEVYITGEDFGGLVDHLALRNPQCCFGNRGSEVVDLNTIELVDIDKNTVVEEVERRLVIEQSFEAFVLQTAEREECLGKEVATTAGRVKEAQRSKTLLVIAQLLVAFFLLVDSKDMELPRVVYALNDYLHSLVSSGQE